MVSCAVLGRMWSWQWNWANRNRNRNRNSIHGGDHFITAFPHTRRSCGFKNGASLSSTSGVHYDTLRVLEWDKLCDSVASFAATSLGRQATKTQLWSLSQSYQESLRLLQETNAAIQMHNHTSCSLSLSSINIVLVKSAIQHASRGSPVTASEALAVATMQEAADLLQLNLKAAIKEDADWYQRFMPLTPLIMDMVINPTLVRSIQQVINEDGTVKDSASSALKQSRDKVRLLEKKGAYKHQWNRGLDHNLELFPSVESIAESEESTTITNPGLFYPTSSRRCFISSGSHDSLVVDSLRNLNIMLHRLMDSIIGNELKETSFLEICNIDGRVCLKSGTDQLPGVKGLLLSSNSSSGRIVEPLTVVPLNDELQQAKASMARAETDVLLMLTEKIKIDMDDIEEISNSVIKLDVINARATYCLSFGGSSPNLLPPEDMVESFDAESHLSGEKPSEASSPTKKRWILYMPNAHHPLLLQQHRRNVQEARKVANNVRDVSVLEQARPVPVDFFIPRKTRVLIITGPNTGGKTISLKTVGLAALMAKSGLHVLSSESVQIPWFDSVFADIGDEQSLSQSLSTFSGHLKQISDIRSRSTNQSLVLLDEVGAGTNPLEGAALGMSLLESFGNNGALLTIATTHHGELKSLKYSNEVFENACMEFDEVNLKPTYKILWGVPGRSNAINVSKKMGLPSVIINNARDLYGAASAEINEVILDMERFKQEFQVLLSEAHHHLMFSRNLYEKLLLTRRRIREHGTRQRLWKVQQISESAATARSVLHKKVRQLRIPARQSPRASVEDTRPSKSETLSATAVNSGRTASGKAGGSREKSTAGRTKVPEVGDEVKVSSLGRKATVLRVDASKGEIVVQAGNLKLKLKLVDIEV